MENINWNIVGDNRAKIKFVIPIGNKKVMEKVININVQQQQQQQSSKEDSPDDA